MPQETMTNGEVWAAYPKLGQVAQLKLPVRTSFGIAKLMNALEMPYKNAEQTRAALVQKYGEEKGNQVTVEQGGENWASYMAEFAELMSMEVLVEFETVTLPESVTYTCDKCKQVTERPLEIEPATLVPLSRFVTLQ